MEKEKKRGGAMHVKAGASRELLSYKVSSWKPEEAGAVSPGYSGGNMAWQTS